MVDGASSQDIPQRIDVKLIDGAAMVHALKPKTNVTTIHIFEEGKQVISTCYKQALVNPVEYDEGSMMVTVLLQPCKHE